MKNDYNDNYIDLGEEISRTIKKVLNVQDFYDLKNTINRSMRNIPGMGGRPFYNGPFDNGFPPLSKTYEQQSESTYQQSGPSYQETGSSYQQSGVNQRQSGTSYQQSQSGTSYQQTGAYHQHNVQSRQQSGLQKNSKGASSVPSVLLIVFGSIGTSVTGLMMLLGIAVESYRGNPSAAGVVGAVLGVPFLAFITMILAGIGKRKRLKRFRLYQKVLNGRTYCTIKELSAASGRQSEYLVKDIRKMIHAGLFPEGYFDRQETCLMTDYSTYQQYLESMKYAEKQREEEKREAEKWANRQGGEELRETIEEGKNYIRSIKAANDALPEEEISEKLDQLELISTKIFNYVEQHPEKLPEIRKFMCYYMPITLKLVNAYQKFDRHGMNSSEIESTKLEIKGTLDTINKAYENLLRKLMKADILDVTSDISALETILAQEGLTEEPFSSRK